MLTKTAWVIGTLAIVAAGALTLVPHLNVQLSSPEPKPANVPDDAVAIPYIAKSLLWAKCWVDGTHNRCRIFNGAGKLLQDDVFITYSRESSVAAADLVIVPQRSGPDYLWLKNGEILLPVTNYPEHRRSVEKLVQSLKPESSLRGTVVDSEGAVIWMAHVVIHPDLTGREGARPSDQTLRTGRDGRFSAQLDPGFYDVCVMADAFVPACQKIAIEENKTVEPRFPLQIDHDVIKGVADTFPTAEDPR